MRKMHWTPECRTGIEEIDSQHRLLFAIANEFMDIDNVLNQEQEVKYLFRHLQEYVTKHFAYEENFMETNKYPGYKEHKDKHLKIIAELKECLVGAPNLSTLKGTLEDLLERWIKTHILLEDKKYSDWAKFHKLIPG